MEFIAGFNIKNINHNGFSEKLIFFSITIDRGNKNTNHSARYIKAITFEVLCACIFFIL